MDPLELEAVYSYPIAHVWEALGNPDSLARWLMVAEDFRPVEGQKFKFRAKPIPGLWKGIAYCQVLKVEKPRLLCWSQAGEEGDPKPFVITWTLKEEGQGTRLCLRHEGFYGLKGMLGRRMMGAGWKRMFHSRIPTVLEFAGQNGWEKFPTDRRLTPSDCGH